MSQAELDTERQEETPDEDLKLAHYEAIRTANHEAAGALVNWQMKKDEAAEAKKIYDGAIAQLTDLIAAGPDRQRRLFNPFGEEDNDEEPAEAPTNDAWRTIPVEDALDLSDKQFERLHGEGIHNVGQLEDFRAHPGLHTITGVGPAMTQKIEDQILEWLDENRDRFGEVVEEPEDEDEPAEDDETDE